MIKENLNPEINGFLDNRESAIFTGSVDKAISSLDEQGYKLASWKDNFDFASEYEDSFSDWHNRSQPILTSEAVLYIPNKAPRLFRPFKPKKIIEDVLSSHKNGQEYYPSDFELEDLLGSSTKFYSCSLGHISSRVPIDQFATYDFAPWLFGNKNQLDYEYKEIVEDKGDGNVEIRTLSQEYVDSLNRPFVRQMFFGDVGVSPVIDTRTRLNPGNSYSLRGLREITEEGKEKLEKDVFVSNIQKRFF